MIYSFICNTCKKDFELSMSLDEYVSHAPRKVGNRVVSIFFQCSNCGSMDTRRSYLDSTGIIYRDSGFTKFIQEEEE